MTIDYSHCKTPALNDLYQDIKTNRTMPPTRRQRFLQHLVEADRAIVDVDRFAIEIADLEGRLEEAQDEAAEARTALQIANERLSEAGFPPAPTTDRHAHKEGAPRGRKTPGHTTGFAERDGGVDDHPTSDPGVAADGAGDTGGQGPHHGRGRGRKRRADVAV